MREDDAGRVLVVERWRPLQALIPACGLALGVWGLVSSVQGLVLSVWCWGSGCVKRRGRLQDLIPRYQCSWVVRGHG